MGALASSAGLVYLQTAVSWTAGFGVPAAAAGVAALLYGAAYARGWVVDGRAAGAQTGTSTSGLVRLGRALRRRVRRGRWCASGPGAGAAVGLWGGGASPSSAAAASRAAAEEDADAARLARLLPAWLAMLGWNLAYATASTVMVQQV